MAWSERAQMRIHGMSLRELVKRISAASLKKDLMSLPETEALWHRTPDELKGYLVRVLYERREPWRLRGAPMPKSDQNYFDHWLAGRDRDFPELRPGYTPPPDTFDEDNGDDDAGSPPPPGP
ncbi:hypothetical protein [Roseibium polysiphoniae]|uniref:Uncharacterized protein n=1 Tax=Roseibium polysiphoniae TaxID=2571221 RepID=A0ABR9CFH4_9HYPH|nr:hypothetical protein [Roseibium polysiphoniae]MBD8877671.1 hypothetical protein [Roseibium polysiphoniae]